MTRIFLFLILPLTLLAGCEPPVPPEPIADQQIYQQAIPSEPGNLAVENPVEE